MNLWIPFHILLCYTKYMKRISNKTDTMKRIEHKLGGDIEEILRRMYVDEHQPIGVICETLGISYVTALKWLNRAGIRSRMLKVDSL